VSKSLLEVSARRFPSSTGLDFCEPLGAISEKPGAPEAPSREAVTAAGGTGAPEEDGPPNDAAFLLSRALSAFSRVLDEDIVMEPMKKSMAPGPVAARGRDRRKEPRRAPGGARAGVEHGDPNDRA
jgi:hypothetical protein